MRGCLCRTLLLAFVHVLPFIVHNDAFRIQSEDIRIIDDSSTERFKPRRWSEVRDGRYQMVVSGREGEEPQEEEKLKANESIAFSRKDPVPKKVEKSTLVKPDTKENPTESPNTDYFDTTTMEIDTAMEKLDKVTQRIILKHGRKRSHPPVTEMPGSRKQRRNSVVSPITTGAPHTMSYNLYNHFRPLEQDVPQDHILPFLDFGRKLTTGPPPNAMNSIESLSSTRASVATNNHEKEEEELFHENMDVTVMKKAVERNTVPRGMFQLKDPVISAYFRKRMQSLATKAADCNNTYSTSTVHPLVKKLMEKRMNVTKQSNSSACEPMNIRDILQPAVNRSLEVGNISIGVFDTINKTDILAHHLDLQSNESRTKSQHIDSPPELKKNTTLSTNQTNSDSLPERTETEKSSDDEEKVEINPTSVPKPNPTAKILSTAVVTSVSVKESPSNPLPPPSNVSKSANNSTPMSSVQSSSQPRYDKEKPIVVADLKPKRIDNSTRITTSLLNQRRENLTLLLNHQIQNKSKTLTTLRPKPTFRPVTFRATFRRNLTRLVPPVIRVASTPHSYIEVPKILVDPQDDDDSAHLDLKSTTKPESSNLPVEELSASITTATTSSIPKVSREPVLNSTRTFSNASSKSFPPSNVPAKTELVPQPVRTSEEFSTVKITVVTQQTYSPSSTPITELPIIEPQTTTQITPSKEVPIEVRPSTKSPAVQSDLNEKVTVIEFKPLDAQNDNVSREVLEGATTDVEFQTEGFTEPPLVPTESISEKAVVKEDANSTNPKTPGFMWIYNKRNRTVTKSVESVGVVYKDTLGAATYVLAVLGVVPLLLGAFVLVRQLVLKRKKKVLDESEYSSEYNRSPLPTKLPRLPAHINWEAEKLPAVPTLCKRWEFPREKLRLQTVLGQGNFGQVWKAEADDISGHEGLTRLVAVKTVKEGASLREKEDLLRELGIMQDLGAHPNVVTLLGCCTDKEPYLLIMEYVMYGKMLAFLREHRTRAHYFNFSDLSSALTSRDLTVFAYCVARGMEYLVTKGIIHRDLAARNILVDHNKLCKIADFGMSRNVRDTGQIYEQRPNRGALPIRWMAPESLQFCLFTHKADVWSYGILLWEIITLGSTPYATMGAREVIRRVKEGYRLEKPKHCRQELYKVASKCWNYDPAKRPTFSELRQDIAALLGDKETGGGYVDLEALAEEVNDHHNN